MSSRHKNIYIYIVINKESKMTAEQNVNNFIVELEAKYGMTLKEALTPRNAEEKKLIESINTEILAD